MDKLAFVLWGLGALIISLYAAGAIDNASWFAVFWFSGSISWAVHYNTPEQKLIRKRQGKKY